MGIKIGCKGCGRGWGWGGVNQAGEGGRDACETTIKGCKELLVRLEEPASGSQPQQVRACQPGEQTLFSVCGAAFP